MKAIVTVKFDSITPEYDPMTGRIRKVVGVCPISHDYCSDVYGKHHSYIETGKDLTEIREKAYSKFGHVTRIEIISSDEETVELHSGGTVKVNFLHGY